MEIQNLIKDLDKTVNNLLSKSDLTTQEKADVMKVMGSASKVSDVFSSIDFENSDFSEQIEKMNEIQNESNAILNKLKDGFNNRK